MSFALMAGVVMPPMIAATVGLGVVMSMCAMMNLQLQRDADCAASAAAVEYAASGANVAGVVNGANVASAANVANVASAANVVSVANVASAANVANVASAAKMDNARGSRTGWSGSRGAAGMSASLDAAEAQGRFVGQLNGGSAVAVTVTASRSLTAPDGVAFRATVSRAIVFPLSGRLMTLSRAGVAEMKGTDAKTGVRLVRLTE